MSIRVCTCCYHPEVINPVLHPSDTMNQIALPDDTPTIDSGQYVYADVLLDKGISWCQIRETWLDKSGEPIVGLLDLSQVSV